MAPQRLGPPRPFGERSAERTRGERELGMQLGNVPDDAQCPIRNPDKKRPGFGNSTGLQFQEISMTDDISSGYVDRRTFLRLTAAGVLSLIARPAAAAETLTFDELYGTISVLGLQFSDKVKSLDGKAVSMDGFMAPPLKAEANFFVLTEIPMALCPFCSSDADWPDNIVVIYLSGKQTFLPGGSRINVEGTLEMGSWTDPNTGFLSRLRIRDARFRAA
jgi:hypothetical protein